MSSTASLTDASRELVALATKIRDHTPDNGPTVVLALSSLFQVGVNEPLFVELLGAITARIHNLGHFLDETQDSDLDEALRSDVRRALASFANLVRLDLLSSPFEASRKKALTDEHLSTLKWFGQTARRHRPLRVIDKAEREKILEEISKIESGLAAEPIAAWMAVPLRDGLARMKVILQHFDFFGHDLAIEELFLFNRKVTALAETEEGRRHAPTILTTLQVIALVGALFTVPDQAATALDRYASWGRHLIAMTTKAPEGQKLLPAPLAVETKPEPEVISE